MEAVVHRARRGATTEVQLAASNGAFMTIMIFLGRMVHPTIDEFVTACLALNDIVLYQSVVDIVQVMETIEFADFTTLPYDSNDLWTVTVGYNNTFTLQYDAHWYQINILVLPDFSVTVEHTALPDTVVVVEINPQ
jgi:hypothetical protein